MKIKTLKLTNFRRFEELELNFDERLTILIARNGAGKSSILDALATNLGSFLTRLPKVSGMSPKATDFRVDATGKKPAYMRIFCESFNGICWDRTERRDKSDRTKKQVPDATGLKQLHKYVDNFVDDLNEERSFELPIFIHYGTGRGVFDIPQRRRGFGQSFPRFDALHGSLESRTNFKRFVEYFYHLEKEEDRLQREARSFDIETPELKTIRRAVKKLMPDFSKPRTASPVGIKVDWLRDDVTHELRIEQLSDGYRTTLAMVMDIASRMAEANPHLDNPLETEGVILIDEVDLHLHPEWQRDFLVRLIDVFPNVQFIVTTHSPFIVQSIKKGKLIDLDSDDFDLSSDLSKELSIEDITEDIMGLEDVKRSALFNEQVKVSSEYYKLLNEGISSTSQEILDLESRLDEIEEKFGDNPAYVALLKTERRKVLKQGRE